MADQNDPCAGFFFIWSESAAELWLHTKRRQKIPGNDLAIDLDWTVKPGEREAVVVIRNEMLESAVLNSPVEEIRVANGAAQWVAEPHRLHFHQALGVIIGQRSKHDRVHDAEHRRVGADSQGQSDHRNRCKAGVLAQLA